MSSSEQYPASCGGALWQSAKFDRDRTQDYADLTLRPGIVLQLVRGHDERARWEVWAIQIDGCLYREPRDLEGEPLHRGDLSNTLDGAFSVWLRETVA